MAAVAALAWQGPAMADDSIEDRLSAMEQRIRYLEQRVASQDEVIVEKEREIAALTGQEEASADAWFNRVEFSGAIELEAVHSSPYEGDNETESDLATAEFGIAAEIDDWVGGEILVAKDDDDKIELDTATLTIAPPEGAWSLTGGSQGLPFGVYDTDLISDPLTKEIGDTGQVSMVPGFSADAFHGSFFVFDGDNRPAGQQRIEGHGAAVGYPPSPRRRSAMWCRTMPIWLTPSTRTRWWPHATCKAQ